MDAQQIWRAKTDDEVIAAWQSLPDYTDEGQQIIRAEFERRQLSLPETTAEQQDAKQTDPVAPGNPLVQLWTGGYSLPEAYWGWGVLGNLFWVFVIAGI